MSSHAPVATLALPQTSPVPTWARTLARRPLQLTVDGQKLAGDLVIPARPEGLVLFVHGSGSSRFSRRNRAVATALQHNGLATLLFDLLSPVEEAIDRRDGSLRFDMALLSRRTLGVLHALDEHPWLRELPIGLFGASTGAAAALLAAAGRPDRVQALVSRGGRPDLAGAVLTAVRCPVLLLVGENDPEVLELNREAASRLHCPHQLTVIPGASHLFEEAGALEQVSELAGSWFAAHLGRPS
jgi:pimeloyl-ACP methyl ester carboxylesterase